MARTLVALDLGSHSLKCVQARSGLTGFAVTGLSSVPTPRDPAQWPEALAKLLGGGRRAAAEYVCAMASDRVSAVNRCPLPRNNRREGSARSGSTSGNPVT